jgi:hypothetical protein
MEVMEPVTGPQMLNDQVHNKDTCPWHKDGKKTAKKMKKVDPDDDGHSMAPNDGGELGRNMKDAKDVPPKKDFVSIYYAQGAQLKWKAGKKNKVVRSYEESEDEEQYGLQYAPHHLIPGNESLKGSGVVPFLGDDDTISEFTGEGQSSYIKEGFSIGYEVNFAENGVWLPSPYALSNANEWPSEPGIKVIKKRKGEDYAQQAEDFKTAYVAASIQASGGRQFHMRHEKYSKEVRKLLDVIGERLAKMCEKSCPIAAGSEDDGKFDPPPGLRGRLAVLSNNLRRLTSGPRWQSPLYTDDMTEDFHNARPGKKLKARLTKVL